MLDGVRQHVSASSKSSRLLLAGPLFFLIAFILLYRPLTYHPVVIAHPKAKFPLNHPLNPHHEAMHQARPKRVAIIGAGASGSAAALFMARAGRVIEERTGKSEGSLLSEIVVFEKESYIGGRSTTVYPHGDNSLRAIELGASIFVDANKHLVKAAKYFNLTTASPDFGESGIGIWDGSDFLYTTSTSSSWFSSWYNGFTAVRRYGVMSPYRTSSAIKALLLKFANLYDPIWLSGRRAAKSIEDFAERAGLGQEFTTRWGEEWALSIGLGEKWVGEIMEGSTRCNYATNMDQIHALGASVSMATGGAKAVEGGNYQIFEGMIRDSKAIVHLSTEVIDIVPVNAGSDEAPLFQVITNSSGIKDDEPFDQIFYAAPWIHQPKDRSAFHSLQSHFSQPIPRQPYVHLHVTLLSTTKSRPVPSFFGLPEDTILPNTILTTGLTARKTAGHPPPRFQSISWHGETYPGSGEYIVKIFSIMYLKDKILREVIGEEPGWVLRKAWDSYPVLSPTASYPPMEPVKGMQYLAAMEPWVSTMETQTLSGREAVARVVEDWWGLGMGECKGGADAWDWSCDS